jgi:hypothetical protein
MSRVYDVRAKVSVWFTVEAETPEAALARCVTVGNAQEDFLLAPFLAENIHATIFVGDNALEDAVEIEDVTDEVRGYCSEDAGAGS